MKPDIALTLETMGVELKGVSTTLDLEGALELLGSERPRGTAESFAPMGWTSFRSRWRVAVPARSS